MATSKLKYDLHSEEVILKVTKCSIHRDKFISLFCRDCDCLVCSSCIVDNHNEGMHKYFKISQVVETKCSELHDILKMNLEKEQENQRKTIDQKAEPAIEKPTDQQPDKEAKKENDQDLVKGDAKSVLSESQTENGLEKGARKKTAQHIERKDENVTDSYNESSETQHNSTSRENSWCKTEQDVNFNLKRIKEEEQVLSNLYDVLSPQILNRTEFLQLQLENRKKSLLSKLKTLQTDKLHILLTQKTDMEMCASYMEMFFKDPNSVMDLNHVITVKVLQVLKSLPDNNIKTDKSDTIKNKDQLINVGADNNTADGTKKPDKTESGANNVGIMDTSNRNGSNASMKYEYDPDLDVNGIMGNLLGDLQDLNQAQTKSESTTSKDIKLSLSFGNTCSEITKISPINSKTAFVVQEEELYRVDFEKDVEAIKNLKPLMTDVVNISAVSDKGIYICQSGQTDMKRYSTTGQILQIYLTQTPSSY